MRAIAAIVFSMMAFQAAAQDALPPIAEVTNTISGKEVLVEGKIGKMMGSWGVRTGHGTYRAELAVDRDTLAKIQNCSLDGFREPKDCNIKSNAEIVVKGSDISLILYEITLQPEPATDPS